MPVKKKTQERSRRKPVQQIKIAKERMEILLKEAEMVQGSEPDLARRYIKLAKKIGMRYNVHVPKDLKRKYCKYCYSFLPSKGRRLKSGTVTIKCLWCNKTVRQTYKPKK